VAQQALLQSRKLQQEARPIRRADARQVGVGNDVPKLSGAQRDIVGIRVERAPVP
jgi:hypothetical protein